MGYVNEKTLEKLNKVYDFLAPHGGEIKIEDDWNFRMYVQQDDDKYYLYMYSAEGYAQDYLMDPWFKVEITFSPDRERITLAKPIEYLSQTFLGELHIDEFDNMEGFGGIKELLPVLNKLTEALFNYSYYLSNHLASTIMISLLRATNLLIASPSRGAFWIRARS